MTITLRSTTHTGATNKGSALTHSELDGNFTHFMDSGGSASVGFIQSGTGAVSEPVQTTLRRVVWAEQYGFSPSGTAAANGTALSNAVAAAGTGGIVDLGLGTFSFNGLSHALEGVWIRGRGIGTVLNYTGSGAAFANSNQAVARGYNKFSDFKLVDTGTGTIGIDLTAMWVTEVTRVVISSFDTGIYMKQGSVGVFDNYIHNNEITSCGRGVWISNTGTVGIQANYIHIKENRIISPTTCGVQIDAADCNANTVEKNNIDSQGSLARYIDCQGDYNVIRANWLDSSNASNVGVYLRGTRNTCTQNIYAGTFASPAYDISTNANEFIEPNRAIAVSNLAWTHGALNTFNAGAKPNECYSVTSTVSVPDSTTTTLYTLSGTEIGYFDTWIENNNANVYANARVGITNGNPSMVVLGSNACTLSRSGANIQLTHALGSTLTFRYVLLRLRNS